MTGKPPATVRQWLDAARSARELVPDGCGALVPATAWDWQPAARHWEGWSKVGFIPFRGKPVVLSSARRRALAAVFEALDDLPELRCVPSRLGPDMLFTLYLPDATDLRELMSERPAAVHDHGLAWLARAATVDTVLRAALKEAGVTATPFPVADRYRDAVAALERLLGPTGLPPTLPRAALSSESLLFWDPKAANFIVPSARRDALGEPDGPLPYKIDLDLMFYECPLSLQILLVLFVFPVASWQEDNRSGEFGDLLLLAHRTGARLGVTGEAIDGMLVYHLVRNFVSAAADPSAYGMAKARALAPLLIEASDRALLTGLKKPAHERLRKWVTNGG
ncbi:hypothetical protein MF672_001010 [Actinomadura sp. ATCC 31491]|uniref:Aminoglycoside phosphotransferase domain-containing protein n=1 Tax=Actinomadura luzonensis TaxID=2805427 RepID=A0ABT0FJZ4_9ACTN|nr:hypothetical protein [Actinomadura luzonensis]MCK2212385.1 hypothetical protein [Actinomadura luzonensis]